MKILETKSSLFGAGSISKKRIRFGRKEDWKLRVVAVGESDRGDDDSVELLYQNYKDCIFSYRDDILPILPYLKLKAEFEISKNPNSTMNQILFWIEAANDFLKKISLWNETHEKDENPDQALLYCKIYSLGFRKKVIPRIAFVKLKLLHEIDENQNCKMEDLLFFIDRTNLLFGRLFRLGRPKP